jgi:hypothetical protein
MSRESVAKRRAAVAFGAATLLLVLAVAQVWLAEFTTQTTMILIGALAMSFVGVFSWSRALRSATKKTRA